MYSFRAFFAYLFVVSVFSLSGKEYIVRYQTLSSGTVFHIESKENEKIGKVLRQKSQGSVLYSFLNPQELLLAQGTAEILDTNTSVYLKDKEGKKIGGFSADVYNLYPTEYRIFSKDNRLIAKGYMNWLANSFVLFDPDSSKRYLVSYFRPRFKLFSDNWHFDVHEEGVIDLRLLSIIGVFQTAFDLNFES